MISAYATAKELNIAVIIDCDFRRVVILRTLTTVQATWTAVFQWKTRHHYDVTTGQLLAVSWIFWRFCQQTFSTCCHLLQLVAPTSGKHHNLDEHLGPPVFWEAFIGQKPHFNMPTPRSKKNMNNKTSSDMGSVPVFWSVPEPKTSYIQAYREQSGGIYSLAAAFNWYQ